MKLEMLKIVVASVSSGVITLAGTMFLILPDLPTRAEVVEMIDRGSPYVEDRKMVLKTLIHLTEGMDELKKDVKAGNKEIQDLRVQLASLLGERNATSKDR